MSKDKGELLKRAVQVAALKAQEFPIGTQVMYKPGHASLYEKFCAYGFIMGYTGYGEGEGFTSLVFCRFFNDNNHSSSRGWEDMRTVANSEACRPEDLYIYDSRSQEIVDACVARIREDNNPKGGIER